MRFSIYTSCALNYLPKARALAESLWRHQPDARLTLCLNDEIPAWMDLGGEHFDRIWQPGDLGYDRGWIFEHNVMELSTAVKGRALCRMMAEDDAELFVYLDPDVYLFAPMDRVIDSLRGASIGLVPHILAPESTDAGVQTTEISVARHGVYNLGHLFVRADEQGQAFAAWWAARLDRYCFDDPARGLFTDQRWVDLAPAIFEGVRILRDPGLDVASWNIATRPITAEETPGSFRIGDLPLVTYHFSGTGPQGTHRKLRERFDAANPATAEIERIYEDAIDRQGQRDLAGVTPAFDSFEDGTPVTGRARRLYRQHADLQAAFPDPYACPAGGGYLGWLRENRPGTVDGLVIPPDRRMQAFRDLFDADYYLARYPDAARAVASGEVRSALEHYCRVGGRLMMDPNPFFVSAYYLDRAAGLDRPAPAPEPGVETTPLWHYLCVGLANGIEPVEFFDSRWYIEQNGDVSGALRAKRITSPLAHYLTNGATEGRAPGPSFLPQTYLAATPAAQVLVEAGRTRGAFGAFVDLGGVAGRIAADAVALHGTAQPAAANA